MKYLAVCFVLVFFLAISSRSEENLIHKYKVGFSTGLSYPNKVLSYPVFIGLKKTVFFDIRNGVYTHLYTNLNYSSFEADATGLRNIYGIGTNHTLNAKSTTPYQIYSIVAGWGFTTSSTGRNLALRLDAGLYFDYSHQDEMSMTYKNNTGDFETTPIKAVDKYSAGINLHVGVDIPIFYDIIGLCAGIDYNPKLLGINSPSSWQYPQGASLTVGLFGRF